MNYFLNRPLTIDPVERAERISRRMSYKGIDNFTVVAHYGTYGNGDGQLYNPSSASIFDKYIYICDSGNGRIVKWRLNGGVYVSECASDAQRMCRVGGYLYVINSSGVLSKLNPKTMMFDAATSALSAVDISAYDRMLYVITTTAIKTVNPNTLQDDGKFTIPGASAAYLSLTAHRTYLYVLNGTKIFKYNTLTGVVEASHKVTEITAATRIRFHSNYIFVFGSSNKFLVLDDTLNVAVVSEYDNTNWYHPADILTYRDDIFISVDYAANCIELLYGYNPYGDIKSGDTGFEGLTFGDSIKPFGFMKRGNFRNTSAKWRKL